MQNKNTQERFNFLGVNISVINLKDAVEKIRSYNFLSPNYICFPDASVVNEASKDNKLTDILNSAFLTMPDGKPSQLAARLYGHKSFSTVSGFHLCNALLQTNLTHYFYGGDENIIQNLKTSLEKKFPKANILGYKTPPFVSKTAIAESKEIEEDIRQINKLQPDIVWIGISSPKQDYLMHHFHKKLDKSLMLGVGGVFLYFADQSLKSPEWIKKAGLRWLYRLAKEPARLWPKYYGTIKFLLKNCSYFLKPLASR